MGRDRNSRGRPELREAVWEEQELRERNINNDCWERHELLGETEFGSEGAEQF